MVCVVLRGKTMFKTTKDGKALNAMIAGIKRRTATLMVDIHVAAVSCVLHAMEYNNALPATQLVEAISGTTKGKNALRAEELKKWFTDRGCFTWNNGDKPGFKMNQERKATLVAMGDQAEPALAKVPFWEHAPKEQDYTGYDLRKKIELVLKQARKAAREHANDPKTKIDPAMLSALARVLDVTPNDDNENGNEDGSILFLEAPTIEGDAVVLN